MENDTNKATFNLPDFHTFPIADIVETDKDSNVSIPSADDIKEGKDWVDFKEM